jgi:pimeloyl-ACP methyl ester carboxylesterase
MDGEKAIALAGRARRAGWGFCAFDYRGHGRSAGRFEALTIGDWLADTLSVINGATDGPLILVGSSMGAWLACLAAEARAARVAGLVTIAAAADFTEDIMSARMDEAARRDLAENGVWYRPSAYGDGPYPITQRLLDEARDHLILRGRRLGWAGPARLLHGMADDDVPWRQSARLAGALAGADVRVILVKDGDHRLSRPADIALIWHHVREVWRAASAPGAPTRRPSCGAGGTGSAVRRRE